MFTIEFWNIGVGLATLVYQLDASPGTTWTDVRGGIASDDVKRRLLTGTSKVVETLPAQDDTSGWFGTETHLAGPGVALWVQELLVVETKSQVADDSLDLIARLLTQDGASLEPRTNAAAVAMRLGVEASCVRTADASDTVAAFARVLASQTALWAAVMELDHLLTLRLRSADDDAEATLHQLAERELELLRVDEWARRFRADVDVTPLHLDVLDKELWKSIDREWPLRDQLTALDTRLRAVERVYQHLTNSRSAKVAKRISGIGLAIAFVSFAAFMLSAYEFLRTPLEPIEWPHTVAALALVVTITLGLYVAFHIWAAGAWRRRKPSLRRD